jgi:inorganic triphosphatase YgiF
VNANVERELKLVPADPGLLDRLAAVDRLGSLEVHARHHELQRNAFFDNASRTLGRAHVGFRRRTVQGERMAAWTIKGESEALKGIATRSEIELQLDPDMAPALTIGTLQAAARSRGAAALAEAVSDALASGGLPRAIPYLETETDRTILDLVEPERGWSIELALDRVRLVGHDYDELEIEAELKRGDDSALEHVRAAIEAIGTVHESKGSKLSRALAHLSECDCVTSSLPS